MKVALLTALLQFLKNILHKAPKLVYFLQFMLTIREGFKYE